MLWWLFWQLFPILLQWHTADFFNTFIYTCRYIHIRTCDAVCNHLFSVTPTQWDIFHVQCACSYSNLSQLSGMTRIDCGPVYTRLYWGKPVSEGWGGEAAHHSSGQVSSQRSPAQDQRQHSKHHHPAGTQNNSKVTGQLSTIITESSNLSNQDMMAW